MICPACKANVPDGFKFCTKCGLALANPYAPRVCANCGTSNDSRASFCSGCGKNLLGQEPTPTPAVQERTVLCPSCGRMVRADYYSCPHCGTSLLGPTLVKTAGPSSDMVDDFPTVAGIILIIAGVIAFVFGFYYLFVNRGVAYEWWSFFYVVSGELAILAGGFSIARYHLLFTAGAAVLVALTIGPLFVTLILGVASFVMIVLAWERYSV